MLKELVKARTQKLQEYLQAHQMDAAVILKPENVFYYSNFNPVLNSHPCFVLIPAVGESSLLVHSLRATHVEMEASVEQTRLYGKWGNAVPVAMDPYEAIQKILGSGIAHLAVEKSDMTLSAYEKLRGALRCEKVSDISAVVKGMKIIKDAYEIDTIRKAAMLVDRGVEVTIDYLAKGYSEAEASTEGQYAMRKMWHSKFPETEVCGFGTSEGGMIDSLHVWCLSNDHIAYGCDCPKHYHPQRGDISLPMAWAKVSGYHAENERTIIIGQLEGTRKIAYEAMLEARKAVFDCVKPGVGMSHLYTVATDIYTDYGFKSILPGRIGHGVGSSAHEFPSVSKESDTILMPGMVFTVEPGLMDKAWGGVRHSDTVLVTETGYECLTKLDNGSIAIDIT